MESRPPTDIQATGTLPLTGDEAPSLPSPGPSVQERPAWLQATRDGLTVPGKYLAYEESGREVVAPLAQEWTRIGRSLAADIRFDDATVSRRHALVVHQADGTRVLDDRSLNGVYVNGERVEWSPLHDEDEILVGRHSLWFLDATSVDAEDGLDTEPVGA